MGLLDQAHSFAQGASNGVAGSLTGPVDGLAWLLRKAGVPVPEAPMGGSDWMRNVGLMQEPKERIAGLLGEGIGSALPTVIAGKAPQIAGGLLQMERNAMAPRTLNPQTGAIVWHGSPHKFDKFDSSKIGTGEGAQAYGHGLYLAEHPDVAKGYQSKLTDPAFKYAGMNDAKVRLNEKIAARVEATDPARAAALRAEVASLGEPGGSLYKVDLPDEHIAKMLDWDKPLSAQSKEVQAGLKQYLGPEWDKTWDSFQGVNAYDVLANGRHGNPTGSIEAAEKLRKAGIPGIRYLDGGSRGRSGGELVDVFQSSKGWQAKIRKDGSQVSGQIGDIIPQASQITTSMPFKSEQEARQWAQQQIGAGTSNYVVFPGNEGLLKILERNGQGLPGN